MSETALIVHELSVRSLRVIPCAGETKLATATGFVVMSEDQPFLITNGHVVTGRNANTGELLSPTLAEPGSLVVLHHRSGSLGEWVEVAEALRDDYGKPLWLEHPTGLGIDVVALPLSSHGNDVDILAFPTELADIDAVLEPAMPVSIIGFPLGLASAGHLPIWKTGHIASDPDIGYEGQPAFLIDATTRGGMSGSPVVLKTHGGYRTADGRRPAREITKFLGVYSGRIHEKSEIGIVWKPNVLREILDR